MAVAYEPLKDVGARVEEAGDGPIISRRRVLKPSG